MDEFRSAMPDDMPYGSQLQIVGAKRPRFRYLLPSSIDPFAKKAPAADRLSTNASLPTQPLNHPMKNNWCRDGIYQAISQRNLEVLEYAFAFSPKVAADQALFLGKSIKLKPEMVKQWFEHRRTKGPGFEIRSRRRASRIIAQWKRKIIDQGLSAIQDPTRDQLDFLAAGLNLVYDQIHGLLAERDLSKKSSHSSRVSHDMIDVPPSISIESLISPAGSMLTVGTTVTDSSTCSTTPGSVAKVSGSWSIVNPFSDSSHFLDFSTCSTTPGSLANVIGSWSIGNPFPGSSHLLDDFVFHRGNDLQDNLALHFGDSDLCSDTCLLSRRLPPLSPNFNIHKYYLNGGTDDTNNAKSAINSRDQSILAVEMRKSSIPIIVQEPDPGSDLNESFEHDNDAEQLSDECESLQEDECLEWRVASILGQEYAHLVAPMLACWSSEQGLSQCASGTDSGSTPASGSTGSPGRTSATKTTSTNTSLSGTSSGEKRKFDSNGNNSDKANDEGEDNPPKRPKIVKVPRDPQVPKPQWDCILFKIDPFKHSECGIRSFPFRHLWQHLERSHLMCQSCGKKLRYNDALKHLIDARESPTECEIKELDKREGIDFVGISTFTKLNDIYREKISDLEKWGKWWRVLSSGPVPDPTHDEMITILTSKIPATIEDARKLWDAEIQSGNLKDIDKDEQNAILNLLGKAIQLSPILQRKPRQSRMAASRSNAGNPTSMNHTIAWLSGADPLRSSGSPWNGLDPNQPFDFGNFDPLSLINGPDISQSPGYGGLVTDPGYNLGMDQIPGYDSASTPNPPRNMNGYGYEGNSAGGN